MPYPGLPMGQAREIHLSGRRRAAGTMEGPMSKIRIDINGFGRAGRCLLKTDIVARPGTRVSRDEVNDALREAAARPAVAPVIHPSIQAGRSK